MVFIVTAYPWRDHKNVASNVFNNELLKES